MSAALIDEFTFEYAVPVGRAQRMGHRPLAAVKAPAPARRPAPCDHGVPIVSAPRPSVRLTDRGLAVVLVLFVGLFVAGLAVLVGAFLAVSDSPVHTAPAAASGVVSVIGG